jgi:hypothetical protein
MPAYLHALLEQTADSLENCQRILVRSEESRTGANAALTAMTDRLGTLSEHMRAGQVLMVRLAENQMELKPSLERLATVAENSLGQDDRLAPSAQYRGIYPPRRTSLRAARRASRNSREIRCRPHHRRPRRGGG